MAPPTYLADPQQLSAESGTLAQSLYSQMPPADDADAYGRIDALCRDYIVEALASLGAPLTPGSRFTTSELQQRLGIVARHQRLFGRLLEIVAEDGVLSRQAEAWVVNTKPPVTPTTLQMSTLVAQHSQCDAELSVLAPCGNHLADAITGKCDPMQLLFPGGSLDLATKLYYETRPIALFNTLLTRCLTDAIRDLPADRPLRILEIGAGTGGTTARVLPELPRDRTTYVFTDVSPQFLDRARQRFGEYGFVEYQLFDLEQSAEEQGITPGSFDVHHCGKRRACDARPAFRP